MQEVMYLVDAEAIKAAIHPLRQELLFHLGDGPRTATQLAEALKTAAPRLSYHLRVLEKHGLIRLVEERRVGNLVEKYFEPMAKSFRISGEAGASSEAVRSVTSGLSTGLRDLLRNIGVQAARPRPERQPIFGTIKTFRAIDEELLEIDQLLADVRSQVAKAIAQQPGARYQLAVLLGPAPTKGAEAGPVLPPPPQKK